MDQGKIYTYQELKSKREWRSIDEWQYNQLKHFTEYLPQPIRSEANLLPLEKICVDKGKKRVISKIYRALIERTGPDIPPYIIKWENELGICLRKEEISQIMRRVHTTTVNSNMREMNYKCLVGWHITPDKAHKIQKEKSQYCWRGCKEIGTMANVRMPMVAMSGN